MRQDNLKICAYHRRAVFDGLFNFNPHNYCDLLEYYNYFDNTYDRKYYLEQPKPKMVYCTHCVCGVYFSNLEKHCKKTSHLRMIS